MKFLPIIIWLCISQTILSQTDKFVNVLGTKCSIVPPEGFVKSNQFFGFSDTKTSASIKIEEKPIPFQDYKDNFESIIGSIRGLTLIDMQELDFNRSDAILVKVRQELIDTSFFSWMLVFGNEDETVYVKANFPENDSKMEEKLKASILSTHYNFNINPTDAADFKVDLAGTDYQCVKFESGGLLYSKEGNVQSNGPSFRIDRSFRTVPDENRKQYALERLNSTEENPYFKVRKINTVNIDNLEGYEILSDRSSDGSETVSVYRVILFPDSGGYYLFEGRYKKELNDEIEVFKKIAMTFKRK